MTAELAQEIAGFLAAHHVLSLATISSGAPHAVNLFYACDELALVWLSDPQARHSRDLEADDRVAATVAPDYSDFATIRGAQITGRARRIMAEDKRRQYLALLEARYSFLRQLAAGTLKLREAYAQSAIYRLEPLRMVFIDNTKGFGHKDTLEFPT